MKEDGPDTAETVVAFGQAGDRRAMAPPAQGAPTSSFQKREQQGAEATAPSAAVDAASTVTGPRLEEGDSVGAGNKLNLETEYFARKKSAVEGFRR